MAQMIFDASKYPNGTLLISFDWLSNNDPAMDFEVVEIGTTGRKYWSQISGTSSNNQMIFQNLYSDFELLLIADFTGDEVGGTVHGLSTSLKTSALSDANVFGAAYSAKVSVPGDTLTWFAMGSLVVTTSKDVAPTGLLSEKAIALRLQLVGSSAIKTKVWPADVGGLEAAEPAAWNLEGTYNSASTAAPALVNLDGQLRISTISIGTAGDPAVFEVPGQTVTTPSNLTISNITATTADLNWT